MGLLSGLISTARTTLRLGLTAPADAKAAVDRWAADRKIRAVHHADVSYPKLRLVPPSSPALDDGVDIKIQGLNGETVLSSKLRIEIVTNSVDHDPLHRSIVWKAGMAVKKWSEETIAKVGKTADEIEWEIRMAGKKPKTYSYQRSLRDQVANYAESSPEISQILRYAYNSELSPEEVLFQDARETTILRRMDFRELVRKTGVPETISGIYIGQINKSSLEANNGHFKKLVFPTVDAFWAEYEPGGWYKMHDDEHLTRVRDHVSTIHHIATKLIASKCDLWCFTISKGHKHAVAMVINIKDACVECLDSGGPNKAKCFINIDVWYKEIFKVVTGYIASTRSDVDFAKFEWRYPRVPCQPAGSNAGGIYSLRFMEEWATGDGMDLSKFQGWEEEHWHVKERVKMCASILTDDCNAILEEVKEKARRMHAIRKRRQLMGIVLWILLL